jgi:NTE family protein
LSDSRDVALVLSGGISLGAYQAGAYEALHSAGRLNVGWMPVRLRAFWSSGPWLSPFSPPAIRSRTDWLSVLQSPLFGATNLFKPRTWRGPFAPFRSLYDLDPLKTRLAELVDFSRLNGGEVRVSVATTDIETGELVIFDTARGHRIELDHVLASCGFLPEFPAVEIDGRLLGDGGLSANAPVEAL